MPLHGVVSLLDAPATEKVRDTWATLERDFGLRGVLVMPYPHVSYQVAPSYDRAALESTLAELTRGLRPFTLTTRGLSTFDSSWPVVFVAVEKDPSLDALHWRVWDACLPLARDALEYYHPDAWVPHITLAHGEERNSVPLPLDIVQRIIDTLDPADYRWKVRIDNLALVWDDGTLQRPVTTFRLAGK
jgi:2'-5' RNA ligase